MHDVQCLAMLEFHKYYKVRHIVIKKVFLISGKAALKNLKKSEGNFCAGLSLQYSCRLSFSFKSCNVELDLTNGIFRKNVSYDNIKSRKEPGVYPLSRKYSFGKTAGSPAFLRLTFDSFCIFISSSSRLRNLNKPKPKIFQFFQPDFVKLVESSLAHI